MSDLLQLIKKQSDAFVKENRQIFDYTIDSFRHIDLIFDSRLSKLLPENGASLSKEVELTLFTIASYVGETLIENRVGSYWQLDEKNPDNFFELTIIRPGGSIIWPFQKVWKRFFNGPEDSLYAYGFLITEDYYEKRKLQLEEEEIKNKVVKKSGGSFKDLTNCPSLDVLFKHRLCA